MRYCVALIALLLPPSLWAAGTSLVANGQLEEGLAGWETQAPTGCRAALTGDKPAQGKSALLLQSDGKGTAWSLAPPLTGPGVGEVVLVSLAVRRATGQGSLVLDVVGGLAELNEAVAWEALPPADAAWHRLQLLLRVPPVGAGTPRLAIGVRGQAGAWVVDDLSVTPGSLVAVANRDLPGKPELTGRLPADWKPEGLLDATSKEVGKGRELYVTVNGMTMAVATDLNCYRGHREGLVIYAVNRGQLDKELEVSVAAPPAIMSPAWSVPIKGNGTTRFHQAVQCLRAGEYPVKLTFASGGEKASMPITVKCTRSYPALGAIWNETPTPAAVQAALDMPADLHLVPGAPDLGALGPLLEPLQAAGADLLAAPQGERLTDTQYLAALTQLGSQLSPSFWVPFAAPGVDMSPLASAAVNFAALQRKQVRPAGVFSPPLALRWTWPDGRLVPTQGELLSADKTAGLLAVTVRPPRLGTPCVLGEQWDGKAEGLGGAITCLNRQADFASLRGLLSERQVNLPILVADLQARSSGDERLDALYLARALTMALYQGSTGALLALRREPGSAFGLMPSGVTSSASGPGAEVVRELGQELAAAVPLTPLAASETASPKATSPVAFRPFLRGGEGVAVLWNNTGVTREVALEFRSQPVASHYLRLSYSGDFVQRRWEPIFRFGEEAYQRRRPLWVMRLEPLEVHVVSFRLLDPHAAWLRSVEPYKAGPPPREFPTGGREERTWWRDMLKSRTEDLK